MVHRQALARLHGRVRQRVVPVRQVPHVPVPAEPAGQEQERLRLPQEELAGETGYCGCMQSLRLSVVL